MSQTSAIVGAMNFDPNGTGQKEAGLFALPYSVEESQLVVVPVPWEVTTSFGHGTSLGPDAILTASKQLDLYDGLFGEFYQQGICQLPTPQRILNLSRLLKEKALHLRDILERGERLQGGDRDIQNEINQASLEVNEWLYQQSQELLSKSKRVAVVGGDHSSPFGLIKTLKEKYEDLSILHIDAHMDLRVAYQGYTHSHASIMYNVMEEIQPQALVQMGIRDFCPAEYEYFREHSNIHCFLDSQVSLRLAQGETWGAICKSALRPLSKHVYISFDIDGLNPNLCPNTGTPVPGGLNFAQMEALLHEVSQSGKQVVGFDLCEVAPESEYNLDGWDANVGARVLFKLAGLLLNNQAS
jgi:agmatinase